MHIYVCVCVHVCVHHMCVCVCVCVYHVSVRAHVYVCICVYVRAIQTCHVSAPKFVSTYIAHTYKHTDMSRMCIKIARILN